MGKQNNMFLITVNGKLLGGARGENADSALSRFSKQEIEEACPELGFFSVLAVKESKKVFRQFTS
mgnify:CR=1 FL=1